MRQPVVPPEALGTRVADANRVAAFLAESDFAGLGLRPGLLRLQFDGPRVDVVALMGSSVLEVTALAARLVRTGLADRLLISGGVGHSTEHLREAVRDLARSESRAAGIALEGRGEAEILAELAVSLWGVDPARILLEREARHCGENAAFTLNLLERASAQTTSLLVLQDPTMQRRTMATMRKECRERGSRVRVAGHPTFVPRVEVAGGQVRFSGGRAPWTLERLYSLLLGEIARLRDDAEGYGPRGKGFIEHVDIPPGVLEAWERLREALPREGLLRATA